MTLGTEHTVDPTILVLCDTHIVDVRGRNHVIGHGDGLLPETEVVDAVRRLGYCEETLSVGTLHTDDEQILTVPFDGTGVQGGITHDALHQVGVVLLVEVIFPLQGDMGGRQDWILIFHIDPIPPLYGFILAIQQRLMVRTQGCHLLFKLSHIVI